MLVGRAAGVLVHYIFGFLVKGRLEGAYGFPDFRFLGRDLLHEGGVRGWLVFFRYFRASWICLRVLGIYIVRISDFRV